MNCEVNFGGGVTCPRPVVTVVPLIPDPSKFPGFEDTGLFVCERHARAHYETIEILRKKAES